MKMIDRMKSRSGEMCFDEHVDSVQKSDEFRYDWIRDEFGERLHGKSFIDFGCWTGSTLRQMSRENPRRLAGLDIPGPWAEITQETLPDASIFEVDKFDKLPEGLSEQFDYAFLLETIEHIPRRTEVETLSVVRESLRPGGTLILSTPAAGLGALLDPAWYLVGHRHYRKSTLTRLLSEAGFAEIEFKYTGNITTAFDTIQLYLKKHLLHRFHQPSDAALKRLNTGMQARRTIGSYTLWAIAHR